MSLTPSPAPPPSPEQSARELDALVAERLFGWIRVVVCGLSANGLSPTRRDTFSEVPHYSTDYASMMLVVGAMPQRLGKALIFDLTTIFKSDGTGMPWACQFLDFFNEEPLGDARAATPCRAVCLAALAALAAAPPEGTVRP
jgi:hypothetical protein